MRFGSVSLRSKPKYRPKIEPNDDGVLVIVLANHVDNKIENNDIINIEPIRITRLDLASITKFSVSFVMSSASNFF